MEKIKNNNVYKLLIAKDLKILKKKHKKKNKELEKSYLWFALESCFVWAKRGSWKGLFSVDLVINI